MGKTSEMHIAIQDQMLHTVTQAQNGDIKHLDALIVLEAHRQQIDHSLSIIKEFKHDYFDQISQEATEHNNLYRQHSIETRNGGKNFDYKHIPEWVEAETQKKQIEAKYKSMYNAKINGNPHSNISQEGEELPLPKITYRKSSIIIKPQK